ncbi:hypothetical protein IEQ34_010613 [Dendrobium chrysotoxum]|uniref:Ubiquitin-like protease family profile domain-containing protein n=1 Tax=Dendrobium chrysotoxum TaxID=161865 RepID=A0AAV7GXI4_DENCH|nr:hypothetical protein IEQ34_010613 [Dendrobium chrysotoxum]
MKKNPDTLEKPKPKQDVISVEKIEVLPRPVEINMEYPGKIFLTTEQQAFMDDCFKKFNKKDDAYRGYKQNFEMFIQHINHDSVRDSKLIVQPIYFKGHWIKQIHEDKAGAFPTDIITWKLQTISGVPTQSNNYDCEIFVCKYMERVILRQKMD